MDEQKYWRNVIANEIKAEHDKVRKYYSKQGMNSGGITQEQQVRLNIFALCQSIASTYNADIKPVNELSKAKSNDVVPKPRKPRAKKVVEAPKNIEVETTPKTEEKTVTEPIEANNVVDKVIVENVVEEVVEESGHKDSSDSSGGEATPSLQNEFGELL